MRDQGRLVEWFDDKGYGFIQPNDGLKERVFLHIKDFAQKGPRPIVGCALEYVVQLDGQGRYKAKQVTYLKATQTVHAKTNRTSQNTLNAQKAPSLQPMQIICIVYIVALAMLSISGLLNGMILLFVKKKKIWI